MGSYTRLSSQGRTRTTYHKMPWYHKSANFYGGCLPSREASYLVTASTKDKFNTLWGFLHPCHASLHPLSGPPSSLPPSREQPCTLSTVPSPQGGLEIEIVPLGIDLK